MIALIRVEKYRNGSLDMYKYKICKLKIQDKTLNRALCERCNVKIQDKNI